MKPPLRAEDHHKVTTEAVLARGNNQSSCSRMDVRAFFGKDIDAFMRNRLTPGIGPEGVLVIAFPGRTFHGHRELLGDDPADSQDRCKNQPDFEAGGASDAIFFHGKKGKIDHPAMQPANN